MPDWNKVTVRNAKEGKIDASGSFVKGVAHVCFNVADLENCIRFYRDVLGLAPAFEFIDENGRRFGCYFYSGERTFIELFEEKPEKSGRPSFQHICLEVSDMDKAVSAIQQKGWEMDSLPKIACDGTKQAWLIDPEGNRIELFSYTDKSRQNPWLKK
jgi:catechol 2,3-dioxygenase-like lactoylglutathione lyase family enzyme